MSTKKNRPRKPTPPGPPRVPLIQSQETGPDSVVSLTPQGRALWQAVLDSMSHEAGQPLADEDVRIILKKLREETGQADPQFKDPPVMECLLRLVRTYSKWSKTL